MAPTIFADSLSETKAALRKNDEFQVLAEALHRQLAALLVADANPLSVPIGIDSGERGRRFSPGKALLHLSTLRMELVAALGAFGLSAEEVLHPQPMTVYDAAGPRQDFRRVQRRDKYSHLE